MKLVSVHIRNFGKLSNLDYSFSNGINAFIEENGAGKSTLAAFIKAMLFGMDTIRESDKDFKDRRHYAPFNNQTYGGTLIFNHDNKEYRIERTFDIKSSVKDVCKIYVDKEEKEFALEIGEEILGLDKESFERLLFINSKDIKMESNGNIKKNLNNIIDDTTEGVDYDLIIAKLTEVEKKYSGKKGSLTSSLKDKKKALEEQILNQEEISRSLSYKYVKRNEINKELIELNNKQQALSEQKKIVECWNTYNGMIEAIHLKEEELNNLLLSYPKGYPVDEEIKELGKLLEKRNILLGASQGNVFDDNKKDKLEKLNAKFSKGIPNVEEMELLSKFVKERDELSSKQYGINFLDEDLEKLTKFKKEFIDGIPSDEEISLIDSKVQEYNHLVALHSASDDELSEEEKAIFNKYQGKDFSSDLSKAELLINEYENIEKSLNTINKFDEGITPTNKKKSKLYLFVLIPSILVFGVGIAMFFVNLIAGIILTVSGFLGLITSAFLNLKSRIDSSNNYPVKTNDEYLKQEMRLREKSEEIHRLLAPYGIYTQSVYSDYEKFKNECSRFIEIVNKQNKNLENDKLEKEKINNLENEIKVFLDKYVSYSSYLEGIQLLKDDKKEYVKLSNMYSSYLKVKEENEKGINEKNNDIRQILSKYDIELTNEYDFISLKIDVENYQNLRKEYSAFEDTKSENKDSLKEINDSIKKIDDKYELGILNESRTLEKINGDVIKISTIKNDINKNKEDAEKYKIEKNLFEEQGIDLEQIDYTDDIKEKANELAQLDHQIENDERDVENLEDNRQELLNIKNEIEKNDKRFKLLEKVEEAFNKSQKILDDKYVAPIMGKFEHYMSLIGDLIDFKIEMNRDFNIMLNVDGQLRSDEHLSSGQRSICALCFRLALLDNIYKGDIPFIIMDDPFVSLDEKNMNATGQMLKLISKEEQIIYFSCHKSRIIE